MDGTIPAVSHSKPKMYIGEEKVGTTPKYQPQLPFAIRPWVMFILKFIFLVISRFSVMNIITFRMVENKNKLYINDFCTTLKVFLFLFFVIERHWDI